MYRTAYCGELTEAQAGNKSRAFGMGSKEKRFRRSYFYRFKRPFRYRSGCLQP